MQVYIPVLCNDKVLKPGRFGPDTESVFLFYTVNVCVLQASRFGSSPVDYLQRQSALCYLSGLES